MNLEDLLRSFLAAGVADAFVRTKIKARVAVPLVSELWWGSAGAYFIDHAITRATNELFQRAWKPYHGGWVFARELGASPAPWWRPDQQRATPGLDAYLRRRLHERQRRLIPRRSVGAS